MPPRVLLVVIDSAGIGALPDAVAYGDEGSNTLGHVAQVRPLAIPTLRMLGLSRVVDIGGDDEAPAVGAFGRMGQASAGKDSVTGHWELMGVVLDTPFPTFPGGFPASLIQAFETRIGRSVLGNKPASGTAIIEELGPEHLRTGSPIVYTSADSVFQIAAHEDIVRIDELYAMCGIAFDLAARGLGIGRVIARPFGGTPGHFFRTSQRRDFAQPPRGETLLDRLTAAGIPVIGIGKIEDLFAGRGIARALHSTSDAHGLELLLAEMASSGAGLIFVNLVDSDTQYGHRNDPAGYAANLERCDAALGVVMARLKPEDLLIVTADHGNDPTTSSTDHSREYVPVLVSGPSVAAGIDLGTRATFADLGQTIAERFGVAPLTHGTSFLADLMTPNSATMR